LLRREQRSRPAQTALHFVEDQRAAGLVAELAQQREELGGYRRTPPSPATGSMITAAVRSVMARDAASSSPSGTICTRRGAAQTAGGSRTIGRRERREQPAVERSAERDDLRLLGPFARELERALVRSAPELQKNACPPEGNCVTRQLRRQPFARFGAIQVGDVHQPRLEGEKKKKKKKRKKKKKKKIKEEKKKKKRKKKKKKKKKKKQKKKKKKKKEMGKKKKQKKKKKKKKKKKRIKKKKKKKKKKKRKKEKKKNENNEKKIKKKQKKKKK